MERSPLTVPTPDGPYEFDVLPTEEAFKAIEDYLDVGVAIRVADACQYWRLVDKVKCLYAAIMMCKRSY